MGTELSVTVGGLRGKMQLTGRGHTSFEIPIDYFPPLGEDQGFTPLELFLLSLAACSGHTVQFLLGKMGKTVTDLEVSAVGDRRTEEHPTLFTKIALRIRLKGEQLDAPSVEKAIRMAEEKFCPVWAMLKNSVPVSWEYEIG